MPLSVAAKIGITVALQAANMALTMSRKIEGQRLDDLKFTQGDYNAPLPLVWGTRRIQGNIFWAEDLTEVKRRRKTKGGKFNDYTYFGTWAVAVAGHEIDTVTRIWADTHLIFDATGAGPIMPFGFGDARPGTSGSDYITIYTGSETQTADPRMQATVEAAQGVGSCPAYRGTAYVMFKDIPLEKFGNRIPQISVEVVSNAAAAYPAETFATGIQQPNQLFGFTFSPDYSRFLWAFTNAIEVWDTASRTQLGSGAIAGGNSIKPFSLGIYNDGRIWAVNEDGIYDLGTEAANFTEILTYPSASYEQDAIFVLEDGEGVEHYGTRPFSSNSFFYFDGVAYDMLDLTGVDWKPFHWFRDEAGNIWAAGKAVGIGATAAYFYRMVTVDDAGPQFVTASGLTATTDALGEIAAVRDPTTDKFVLAWNLGPSARLYLIDPADGSVDTTQAAALNVYNTTRQFANLPPGETTIWLDAGGATTAKEVSLADLSTVRTVTMSNWDSAIAPAVIYDPVNHALITANNTDQEIIFRYLDRFGDAGVTLGSIVADIAGQCAVGEYSFTALDQSIDGWSAVRGQASSMIEPLLDVYDSDIAPVDFSVNGLKRAGVTSGTLETEYFVTDGDRYSVNVRQGTELPRSLTVGFADLDAEQQPNNVRSDRPLDATGARGEKTIDMSTLAIAPTDARALADRHFARLWNSSRTAELGLTRQQLTLTPGDVRTLDLDGEQWAARLTAMTIGAGGKIATEWTYDHPALALLPDAAGAGADGHVPSVINYPVPTKGFVLDIPLVRDADDGSLPVAHTAAAPYAAGSWGGATIFRDDSAGGDGEFDEDFASFASTDAATWGRTTDALGSAAPFVWDRGNVVNIVLQNGTLTGATEDDVDANPRLNLMLIGQELVQFTTAALQGDGSYNVSGFKRGRRGTEWAVGTHAAGEAVLLMDQAVVEQYEIADVGTTSRFQAITFGRGDGFIETVALNGTSLKPYAPANVVAQKKSNGDWVFTWNRRTRIGAGWGVNEVPLGEASEAYELVLGDGVSSATKSASSETYTWTSAAQTTDTGGDVPVGSLEYSIAQVSATVGSGFATTGTA